MTTEVLIALGVPTIAGLFAWLNSRSTATNALVDQLQEQLSAHEERLTRAEVRIRWQDDYIDRLRAHIRDELGPPPPPYPTYPTPTQTGA